MNKCKVCNKNCEGEFCFRHKRRPINVEGIDKRNDFFSYIWKKRDHYCENCGEWLGKEPLSYYFHHIISKQKQKNYAIDITYDEENIIFVCLECHSKIEMSNFTTPFLDKKKTDLTERYKPYIK